MQITLNLESSHVITILKALDERPHKEVSGVISVIQQQVNASQQPNVPQPNVQSGPAPTLSEFEKQALDAMN
jgi:hypothetical protein